MKNETICGYAPEEIKKYFFKGKLSQLINDMQAEGKLNNAAEARTLKAYLGTLKLQNTLVVNEMKEGFSDEMGFETVIAPPSVDELVGEDKTLDSWIADKDKVLADVRSKMKLMRDKMTSKDFDIKELQDLAFELSFWRNWIVQDTIYKRQLWKQKLTRLIDDYEISRREAEDRSELTKEYRDYILAFEFQKSVEDLIVSARKGYTE